MVSRSVQVQSHTAQLHRRGVSSWLASTAFSGAFAALIAAFPQSALACVGEDTGNVLCDAANPATGGMLTTSFAGTTVVAINPGARIDTGPATVTVTAPGSLTFTNSDTIFGIPQIVILRNDFGDISYIGNAAASAVFAQGTAGTIGILNTATAGDLQAIATGSGNITIDSNANVTGIYGQSAGGDVFITGSGSITSTASGISAATTVLGNATITWNGPITSTDAALFASTVDGNATVTGSGNVTSADAAGTIKAWVSGNGPGNALIAWNGAVTNTGGGAGLYASTNFGSATVNVLGNVTSTNEVAVRADSANATATVTVANGLTLTGVQNAINVGSAFSNVNLVVGDGASISASVDAIYAHATGNTTATIGAGTIVSGGTGGGMVVEALGGIATVAIGGGATVSGAGGISIVASSGSLTIGNGAHVTQTGVGGYGVSVQSTAGFTLFNAGIINGSTTAISFVPNGGLNTLTLAPTSVISGQVVGGASSFQIPLGNVPGVADIFQLGGAGAGTFDVSQIGDAAQYSGFGTFNKVDPSIWTLTGTPGQATSWTINGGTLSVANDISLGAANEALSFNGGLLQVTGAGFTTTPRALNWGAGGGGFDIADPANAFTVSQALGAGGALTKRGAGTLILSAANSHSGTIVDGGTLRLAGAGTLGGIGGAVILNGGLLDLGGSTQTQNGGLTLTGGTLANGRLSSSGAFNVSGGTIDAVLTGTGHLVKSGAGTTLLNGVQQYTGVTEINGGTMSVNGSITSSSQVRVIAGGTLGGNGTVGNTLIDGGALAPGNSIGLLTVQGNLVFTAASHYMVEVSPGGADRVNVTGTATLGGATVNAAFAAGSYVSRQYTIVNAAGGVTGTFGAQVNTNLPANFTSSLSYDAGNAYLDLALNFTPPSYAPLNANQAHVGTALVGFFNRTGGIPLIFGALNATGLTQVSGETATGSQQSTFDAMNLFMGLITDPFAAGRGFEAPRAIGYANADPRNAHAMFSKAVPPAPAFEARWNVWAAGFGGSRSTDGNATLGSNTARSSIGGVAVGADYWLSPNTVAGFALAGGGTSFSIANGGSGRSDLFQAGAFIRHSVASAYFTAAAAYGWQDITTDRTVTIAGIDRLGARYNTNSYSARIEGGNRYLLPWMSGVGITPYAAVQVTVLDLPGYAETVNGGVNTFALNYTSKTITSPRSELGLRSDKSFAVNDAILTLRGRAAWAHDYNTERSAQAAFQTLPGASFTVSGAAAARDAALTTASAEMKFSSGISLAATFEGEFSEATRSYAGKGVARYAW